MHTAKVTRNGQVTIPAAIRKRLKLREGVTVYFRTEGDSVTLVPAVLVPKDQAWFWTPEWQKREAEAEEDLLGGRGKSFRSAEDALRWLNRKRR